MQHLHRCIRSEYPALFLYGNPTENQVLFFLFLLSVL